MVWHVGAIAAADPTAIQSICIVRAFHGPLGHICGTFVASSPDLGRTVAPQGQ